MMRRRRSAAEVEKAEGAAAAADDTKPQVYSASFSSQDPEPMFWGGSRVVMHNKDSADLSRAADGLAPLLWNHNRMEVIGKILSTEIKNRRGVCKFEFAPTPEAQKIKDLVDGGYVKGISVGLTATEIIWKEADNTEDMLIEKWTLNEISNRFRPC